MHRTERRHRVCRDRGNVLARWHREQLFYRAFGDWTRLYFDIPTAQGRRALLRYADEQLPPDWDFPRTIYHLERGMNPLPGGGELVFRGTNYERGITPVHRKTHPPGQVFQNAGLQAVSRDFGTALHFTYGEDGTLYEIVLMEGVPVRVTNPEEAEIIVSMDTEWGVARVVEDVEYHGYRGSDRVPPKGLLKQVVQVFIRPAPNPLKAEIMEHYAERERAAGRDPDEPLHPGDHAAP